MGKIAVTGGLGFIGTNLVRKLARSNYECVVIDDVSTGLVSNLREVPCSIKKVDICNLRDLMTSIQDCEYIFHLAARGSVPRSIKNPQATFQVNTIGTLNVFECARATGARVAFASSSSVYGSNLTLPKSENMWTGPVTPYAASKLAGEAITESYAHTFGLHCANYRLFNVFGPWQRPDHAYAAVIPKWIWKAINGEVLEIFGSQETSRDFTYVQDVVDILIEGMERDLDLSRPLNLAFGNSVKLSELINFLFQKHPNLKIQERNKRLGDIEHSKNNPERLISNFPNFIPTNFESALESTYDWFLQNGELIAHGPAVSE